MVHDFPKKTEVFYVLCLSKIDRQKVFADVLDKKEAFTKTVRKTTVIKNEK